MKAVFGGKSIVRIVLAWALIGIIPVCQAQFGSGLDKHARKIHKKLVKYPSGTYLSVAFRDGTQSAGALGALTETSFTFTNADNNASEMHSYNEVARVQRGKEYIGEGSGPGHHIRLWVPVVLGVVAAGAAVTALEVR
ncbi:MAG TPA: hypothetical protein VGF96_14015 [Terracidiphilus sp.]|jgi:hypothetical protein